MVLVKSEPHDLHPLEHYVDDRVELVRQIFGSLKTKTINSIIPDFLQVNIKCASWRDNETIVEYIR